MQKSPNDGVRIAPDVVLGKNVKLFVFVNLYGCVIGDETKVGTFVEIQKGAQIGARCKISSHTFICEGVTIEEGVFIGHGVTFINDKTPRAMTEGGELQTDDDWTCQKTLVRRGASVGSGAGTWIDFCRVKAAVTMKNSNSRNTASTIGVMSISSSGSPRLLN